MSALAKFVSMARRNLPSLSYKRFNYEIGSRRIKNGCCLMSRSGFKKFPARSGRLGYDGTSSNPGGAQWILEYDEAERLIDKSRGNIGLLWNSLGLSQNETPIEETLLCIVNPVALWNLREATADTPGANKEFMPTGHTSGGLREMVIDQVPLSISMIASDGDFFVQKYVSTVPVYDVDEMYRAVEIARLAQKQVTSTPEL